MRDGCGIPALRAWSLFRIASNQGAHWAMSTPTKKPGQNIVSEIATPALEVGIMPMDLGVRAKLSVMMFLQYFVWGVWFVTMGTYLSKSLHFQDDQLGWAYAASPIGAMLAPFFVGMIADRFFATQRILAVLHFAGGLVLFAAAQAEQFSHFFPLILVYFFCYMPTLALTNSISFRH